MPDKRAVKILVDTYWSSKGWKSAGQLNWVPYTPPEDLEYAIEQGVMFPSLKMGHETLVEKILKLRAEISPQKVGSAFVASICSGSPALRSALGSYAISMHMPSHSYKSTSHGRCEICGVYDWNNEQDINVMSFERWKWGGVRHEDPFYAAFDLERFAAEPSPAPLNADRDVLNSLLQCAGTMPAEAKLADLVTAIRPIVPGNTSQRRALIGLLGFSGVLRIPGRTGFFREFTASKDREETPWYKDDWPYPVRWWQGGNGLDEEANSFWFGQLVDE